MKPSTRGDIVTNIIIEFPSKSIHDLNEEEFRNFVFDSFKKLAQDINDLDSLGTDLTTVITNKQPKDGR